MNNLIRTDIIFGSVPAFLNSSDKKAMLKDLANFDPNELEHDVEVEDEYLEYLFHYKKDISHITNKK